MAALSRGRGPGSSPPYSRFCARHDPVRVEALEQLCRAILTGVKAIADGTNSAVGDFFPLFAKTSAADAMDDLLEEFLPQFRKLMVVGKPLPGGQTPPQGERVP